MGILSGSGLLRSGMLRSGPTGPGSGFSVMPNVNKVNRAVATVRTIRVIIP